MQLTSEAENYDLISKTWQESENEGDEPATIKYISEIHVVNYENDCYLLRN
jgi:hypothetical protein